MVVHETGHILSLPDMQGRAPGNGVGSFDSMGNSWGLDASAHCPPMLSPHSKMRLGWIDLVRADKGGGGMISLRSSYNFTNVILIDHGFPNPETEYILLKNRRAVGFDGGMGEGGISNWHID